MAPPVHRQLRFVSSVALAPQWIALPPVAVSDAGRLGGSRRGVLERYLPGRLRLLLHATRLVEQPLSGGTMPARLELVRHLAQQQQAFIHRAHRAPEALLDRIGCICREGFGREGRAGMAAEPQRAVPAQLQQDPVAIGTGIQRGRPERRRCRRPAAASARRR